MSSAGQRAVRRRHVLFFGGFDPKGASWYHALYKRHASVQAAVNAMRLDVAPRTRDPDGRQYWTVRGEDAGGICETCFEVVSWDAEVRAHWPRSATGVLAQMLGAYGSMLVHGPRQLLKVARIAPRTLIALLWPLLLLLAGLIASLVLASCLAWAVRALGAGAVLSGAVALATVVAGLWGMARVERRLDTSLLGRIFAFVTRYAVRGVTALDTVITRGSERIGAILRAGECDELLVVGYSVGSILATRAAGQALAAGLPSGGPALALLTLGNCIPLLGLFPQASAYRTELAGLAASDRLDWIDVSSPTDWGSFALLDPLEVCGIAPPARGRGSPLMTSPRFHTLIEPERYRAMLGDKHAIHTLYLMSTDKPGVYDWFAITAGSQPLAARYARESRRRGGDG